MLNSLITFPFVHQGLIIRSPFAPLQHKQQWVEARVRQAKASNHAEEVTQQHDLQGSF
jgi:hypothetical protein